MGARMRISIFAQRVKKIRKQVRKKERAFLFEFEQRNIEIQQHEEGS